MHIGFATMIAVPAIMLVKSRIAKVLWALYPFLVLFVIVVTGNHFWFDAAAGAAVAADLGCWSPTACSRRGGPEHWAFRPAVA